MKSEILNRLRELAHSDDVLECRKEFNELRSQLENLLDHGIASVKEEVAASENEEEGGEQAEELPVKQEESEKASEPEKDEAEKDEAQPEGVDTQKNGREISEVEKEGEEEIEQLKNDLDDCVALFKDKIKKAVDEKEQLEQNTISKARELLEELKALVENEENIGRAFARFNEIRESWKELPKVSNDAYRDLNAEYNKYVERFFYNINIYKELKELDLKHNLEEKKTILEDQRKLLEENDIRLLEVEVRLNQDRWNEIGPTFKEEWDKIKGEFWETTRAIYSKIQEFYEGRREEQEKNLEAKKKLLDQARHIASLELKSAKKWQDKSGEMIEIQKAWKMVGYVPKEQSAEIWKEFKSLCDTFFERKRAHFEELRKVQGANKEAKMQLLNKANELKDSEDWKETSRILIGLQKDWKEIGAAHQRDENKMWREFRQACDYFFKRRNEFRSGRGDREKENLEKKEELLKEMAAWQPKGGDPEDDLKALKAFSEKWRDIGFVPIEKKDEVNGRYKELLDEKYESLDIDKAERKKLRFEEKIENLKDSNKGDFLLRKEGDHLRNKIGKLEGDIIQFENNMGFLANSKGADKLKQDVELKIERARKEIASLKEQLELLRNA